MKALLLISSLVLSLTVQAQASVFDFSCKALSAKTQEGGDASGSFKIQDSKGVAGFSYPQLDHYVIQIQFTIDLNSTGTSSTVLKIVDIKNQNLILASSNSILHLDGLDQSTLSLNLPQESNEISIQCTLKPHAEILAADNIH